MLTGSERDLHGLRAAAEVGAEDSVDAFLAATQTHGPGIVSAAQGKATGQPTGRDALLVVLAERIGVEHDLD